MKYYSLNNSIVVCYEGAVHTISTDDYRYARIKDALLHQDFDSVKNAIDPTKNLNKDGFVVKDGLVCFKDEPIPSVLGNQFLSYKESSWVFKSLLNFWFNLKTRVDRETASDMIDALIRYGAYPLTEDGFYLVYSDSNVDQTQSILNKKNQKDCEIHFYNFAGVPAQYTSYFIEKKNLDDVLASVFGFTAKKLKKIGMPLMFDPTKNFFDHKFLFFGEAFKEVLHPDNLYEVLENNLFKITHGDVESYRNFNTFLKAYTVEKSGSYSQKKILNLIKSAEKKPPEQLLEIGNFYVDLRDKINFDIQSVQFTNDSQEIFEYLRKEHRNLKDPEVNLDIENNFPEFWNLNDIEIDGFRFLLPRTNYDLREWTNIMQNCIGTYDSKVKSKGSVVFALMNKKTNEMVYNVEVSSKQIIQFVTRGNRAPNSSDKSKICAYLKEKGLIYKE